MGPAAACPVVWGFPCCSLKTNGWPWAGIFIPVGLFSFWHIHHTHFRYTACFDVFLLISMGHKYAEAILSKSKSICPYVGSIFTDLDNRNRWWGKDCEGKTTWNQGRYSWHKPATGMYQIIFPIIQIIWFVTSFLIGWFSLSKQVILYNMI